MFVLSFFLARFSSLGGLLFVPFRFLLVPYRDEEYERDTALGRSSLFRTNAGCGRICFCTDH